MQLSGWLQRYDFETDLNDYLMAKARFARAEGVGLPEREARTAKRPQGAEPLVGRTTTLALDFSDLSKPFGGKGMEGMAMGWDPDRARSAT